MDSSEIVRLSHFPSNSPRIATAAVSPAWTAQVEMADPARDSRDPGLQPDDFSDDSLSTDDKMNAPATSKPKKRWYAFETSPGIPDEHIFQTRVVRNLKPEQRAAIHEKETRRASALAEQIKRE